MVSFLLFRKEEEEAEKKKKESEDKNENNRFGVGEWCGVGWWNDAVRVDTERYTAT